MKPAFKIGETVYYLNEFRVVKGIVEKINISQTKENTAITYIVKSITNGKSHECLEASLVRKFKYAKQGAIRNWIRIDAQVREDLEKLTDKSFEPITNENK